MRCYLHLHLLSYCDLNGAVSNKVKFDISRLVIPELYEQRKSTSAVLVG